MLPSAIATPASTSNGKDSRRFYNWRLKDVYESCELPTKTVYAASHTTLSSTYSKNTAHKSSWKHTTHTPPSKSLPKMSSVSLQSLVPASTGAAAAASAGSKSRKKQKIAAPAVTAVMDKEDEEQEAPTKRKTPFKRLAPLTGHLRTCKVLMLPTRSQVLELKRCFSAARRAYNQTVARIKGGAPISAYALQKSFRAEPPPDWATGTQAVASSIMAKAVNQAVGAYTSNFAKKQKDSRVDRRKGQRGKPHSGGRTAKQRGRTTRRLKQKLSKERRRLHNWMQAAHYDSTNFMLERFDVIIQPELKVSVLTKKSDRKLGSPAVRKMLTWSHYAFRDRLKSASIRYAGRHVIESQEPGTSKTCTNCGYWHAGLALSDRTFVCPRCHIAVDRDVAGARNNFFSEYGRAVGVGWDGASG